MKKSQYQIQSSPVQVGGGTLPDFELTSIAIQFNPAGKNEKQRVKQSERLFQCFLDFHIVGVLKSGRFELNMLTLLPRDMAYLVSQLKTSALAQQLQGMLVTDD